MPLPGYQCQKCWATFTECRPTEDKQQSEPKCPTCHSTDVRQVELPEDWVFQGLAGLCFG